MTDTTQPQTTTDVLTLKQPTVNDLVNAVVGASGNTPLACERLRKRGMAIDAETLLATLASDPTADELISKQLRMKAKLTTFQMLLLYQAKLTADVDDEDRPLSQQGAVQGFSAISSLFNALTDSRGSAVVFTGNVLDKILASVTPEAREAIVTLVEKEPLLAAPTPIRKRGRPPGALQGELLDGLESGSGG